ncbi:unnamed protein product [Calypogeia fissa]
MGGGGGGATGVGVGAVLLCAPSLISSSPVSAPVSALFRSFPSSSSKGLYSSKGSCRFCNPSSIRRGLLLSLPRGRRGRRFESAWASKEDEADVNRDAPEPNKGGEDGPVDWDKAWSSFKKPQKRKSFLTIDMEKYVSRQPKHSNYPLSEEVDPLRKSERSLLGAWTSMKFTYAFVVVIIGLVVYMVIIVGPPPQH